MTRRLLYLASAWHETQDHNGPTTFEAYKPGQWRCCDVRLEVVGRGLLATPRRYLRLQSIWTIASDVRWEAWRRLQRLRRVTG